MSAAALERVKSVDFDCVASVVEGDRVAIHWIFEFTDHSGKTRRIDEVALQEWRGDRIFRERFFYDPPNEGLMTAADTSVGVEAFA